MERHVHFLPLLLALSGFSAGLARGDSGALPTPPAPQLAPGVTTSPPVETPASSALDQPTLQSTTPLLASRQPTLQPATSAVPLPSQTATPEPATWLSTPDRHLGMTANASPRWDIGVDALWLARDTGRGTFLGFTRYNDGYHAYRMDNLWSDDVSFPLEPGIRLQLAAQLTDRMSIEVNSWGLQQWSVGRTTYGDGLHEDVLGYSGWLQTAVFDDSLSYSYKSQVANVELNQRFKLISLEPYRSLSWLWGVRYFYLADDFNLNGSDILTNTFENLNWKTKNNLVGAQLGLQWAGGGERLQLCAEAKVGLCANIYSQEGADSINDATTASAFHSSTNLAALFEFSLSLRYRVTNCLWLRGGYQYYGMTGLALGPRQLADYNSDGCVGFDGLSVGVEWVR